MPLPAPISAERPHPSRQSLRGLDWFIFFLADVQTGFGPFIAVYLTTEKWTQGQIGLVLSIGSIIGLVGQMPGGAIVDAALEVAQRALKRAVDLFLVQAADLGRHRHAARLLLFRLGRLLGSLRRRFIASAGLQRERGEHGTDAAKERRNAERVGHRPRSSSAKPGAEQRQRVAHATLQRR